MRKIALYLLLLAAAVPMTSCRRAAEKARQNIRVEEIERFERHGLAGADLTLRVKNDTGYKLSLSQARLEIFLSGSLVGMILLREGVGVARRTTESVTMRWQLKVEDPLALYVLVKKIEQRDLAAVCVSYALKGRGGPAAVNISREMVPVSEFLNTFGLTMEDLGNYLKR